jgi:hypothetical protein
MTTQLFIPSLLWLSIGHVGKFYDKITQRKNAKTQGSNMEFTKCIFDFLYIIIHIIHFQRNWTIAPKGFLLYNGNVLHLKPPKHAPRASKQNKLQGYTPPLVLHPSLKAKAPTTSKV